MKIAIIGTRGIPAHYGGFETCAEELTLGLVNRGHQVSVYCRHGNVIDNPKNYRGVKLIYVRHADSKNLGTLTHAFFSILHSLFQQYDAILVFNVGIAPLCLILKLFGQKVFLNVDGLEWKRLKWGWIAKKYFLFCERIAHFFVNEIITDSKAIQQYYFEKYHVTTTYIAYGAYLAKTQAEEEILKTYGVKKNEYFLVVSRLEPENNADLTIKAFEGLKTRKKLLIIGNANYKSRFLTKLKQTRDLRIKFLNPIYNKRELKALYCGCYAYIHGNEVGGTNPALLQALGYGTCVLTLNVSFNAEVVGESAILYKKSIEDLRDKIQYILNHSKIKSTYRKRAIERVEKYYTWKKVINSYEKLFKMKA